MAAADSGRPVVSIPLADGIELEMVEATNGFFIGKFEVTQEQWQAIMSTAPSAFSGPHRPVEQVSWADCQKFIRKANALESVKKAGLRLRLPTEAEWMLCCRTGGDSDDYGTLESGLPATLDDACNYKVNSNMATHNVGMSRPNAWGIFDMLGNVFEIVDTFVFGGCIIKGGGWVSPASSCRSKYRFPVFTYDDYDDIGFRLAADRLTGHEP